MSKLIRMIVIAAVGSLFAVVGLADAADPVKTPSIVSTVESDKPAVYRFTWNSAGIVQNGPINSDAAPRGGGLGSCDVIMYTPYKSGGTIYATATTVCTSDVYFLNGTDYLYRGLGPSYLIGQQYKQASTNYIAWSPSGSCASSTWAYWHQIPSIQACSTVICCVFAGAFTSNYLYFSC
jgi:hypothetical protein